MMDSWKDIKRQPRLNDLNRFKRNVLNQIESGDIMKKKQNMFLWRIAASVIILLSAGSYAWMELDTYFNQTNTVVSKSDIIFEEKGYKKCDYKIAHLLKSLREAGFVVDDQRIVIQFSATDVKNLKDIDSPFLTEVQQFLGGMEELYPLKYQQYRSGEIVEFNSWHLKKDQRLCDWVK